MSALLFGMLLSSAAQFRAIDSCLAAPGSAWNYRTRSCGPAPSGPVDRIYVDKSDHWLAAYRSGVIIREFRVSLGRGGLAAKARDGDNRVPEGIYTITDHNPASAYHLSLRIGYPTPDQSAAAAAQGIRPGGDIFIHGLPNGLERVGSKEQRYDWTAGCIALTDPEMDWLFQAVVDGTPIEIRQ